MPEFVRVTIADAKGSTPREIGASMLVGGVLTEGTIGGGRLEFDAIAHARDILSGTDDELSKTVKLGPEIGQCCGGVVTLTFEASDASTTVQPVGTKNTVYVFGAGHVGRALIEAFSLVPIDVIAVETRADFLTDLPTGIGSELTAAPEAVVRSAKIGAAFVVTTHDHSLDFLIVEEALRRGDASYVGLIGSKTKRAVLEKTLRSSNLDPTQLVCPIGHAGIGDKRPAVIAAFVVAEVLAAFR